MSYESALKAAGADVHCFEQFGSYQGDWWAKVTYKGMTGWVNGSYGSCSHCDAFSAEFGYKAGCQIAFEEHTYCPEDSCSDCKSSKEDYDRRLIAFGEGYLENILSQEQAEAKAAENIEWDLDAGEMLQWIKSERDAK